MNIEQYVEQLFSHYASTPAIADFKEEISVNLKERIRYMKENGLSEAEAFQKATEELGDITSIADQISEEKHKEVIGSMYLKSADYMKKTHIIGYVICGAIIAFGLLLMLFMYLRSSEFSLMLTPGFLFIIPAICVLTALGLTQESATHYPMKLRRAVGYACAVALILTGTLLFVWLYVRESGLERALTAFIILVIPGGILAALLILTERSRMKPWFRNQQEIWEVKYEEKLQDPCTSTRFGLYCGALWSFTFALFMAFGFGFGFRYSWLVIPFAVAFQLLIQALMIKGE